MKKTLPLLSLMIVLGACKKQPEYILNQDAFCGYKTVLNQKCKNEFKFCTDFTERVFHEQTVCKDANGNLLTGRIIERGHQGQKKSEFYVKDGMLDGVYKEFFANGNLRYRIDYKNGLVNGSIKGFYFNGNLRDIQQQKNGEADGIAAYYSKNGKLEYKSWNKNGRSIKSISYDDQGRIKYESISDGDDNISKEYDDNGSLITVQYRDGKNYNLLGEAHYKNGKLDGIRKLYRIDDKGKSVLLSEQEWKDGELNGVVKDYREKDGSLYHKENYINGMKNGTSVYYGDTVDDITGKDNYVNGLRHGHSVSYYKGKLYYEGNYVNDTMTGVMKHYNTDGNLASESFYDGDGDRLLRKEYKNGQLIHETVYENDEAVSESTYKDGVLIETKPIED